MYLGIDFGTTNTAIAVADQAGDITTAHFPVNDQLTSSFRSVLCFADEDEQGSRRLLTSAGPRAIADYVELGSEARLVQSIKTFLSSKAFQQTSIFGVTHSLEDLIAILLRHLRAASEASIGTLPSRVVAGRPVHFAGERPDEDLAVQRLNTAFDLAGFSDVSLAFEPLAAAYFYASRLDHPETCLIADFGGGTSDFSVVRFEPGVSGPTTTPLGHAGIGIAGDTFDYRIVQQVVCPLLGKNSTYRSWGKQLAMPRHYYARFERWHHLSLLRNPRTLREIRDIRRTSDEPELLTSLLHIIENELGFHLYQAVNKAKLALSHTERATFEFVQPPVEIIATIDRDRFESWIADDLRSITETMENALAEADMPARNISKVFMTGGTSLVPTVRQQVRKKIRRRAAGPRR